MLEKLSERMATIRISQLFVEYWKFYILNVEFGILTVNKFIISRIRIILISGA